MSDIQQAVTHMSSVYPGFHICILWDSQQTGVSLRNFALFFYTHTEKNLHSQTGTSGFTLPSAAAGTFWLILDPWCPFGMSLNKGKEEEIKVRSCSTKSKHQLHGMF